MRAAIRSLLTVDYEDPRAFTPEDPTDFLIGLRLTAGPPGEPGEETFDFTVCTPGWLERKMGSKKVYWPRHHLLISRWDWPQIESYVRGYVAGIEGATWHDVAMKLSRLGHWEFEDYRPEPEQRS